eukprot:381295-Rhodomonas_salina.1
MRECGSPCCVPNRSGSVRLEAAVPSRVKEEGRKRREEREREEIRSGRVKKWDGEGRGEASKVTAGKGKEEKRKEKKNERQERR